MQSSRQAHTQTGLKRTLSIRHLVMLSLGGSIGTGLFLASGAPVFPKTPEAVALHYIDNLDAKLEMFRGAYETGEALAPRVFQRKAPLPANVVLPLPSVLPLEPDGEDALP